MRMCVCVLVGSYGSILVHVGQHKRYIWCEQIIHLIAQRCLAQQLRATHQITDGHVEIRISRWPVRDARKWMRNEYILQGESVLVS